MLSARRGLEEFSAPRPARSVEMFFSSQPDEALRASDEILMWFAMLKPPDVPQLHVPMLPHLRTKAPAYGSPLAKGKSSFQRIGYLLERYVAVVSPLNVPALVARITR